MNRRNCLRASAALGALALLPAFAQTGAGTTMTMVVPYPAGGASDVFARAISPALGRELGRTLIIENISGASGSIAANKVLGARPAGDMLIMASPTEVILAPSLLKAVRYQPEDFRLIGLVDKAPLTVFVRANLPVNTMDELLAYARKPDSKPLAYGSTGPGSFYHLITDSLQRTTGVPMTHVPYRGGAPLLQDLIAGNIDFVLLPASITVGSMVQAGRIKAIGVAGPARGHRLPNVQTFAESKSVTGFVAPEMWAGIMVPSTASPEFTQQLHAAMSRAMAAPEVARSLEGAAAGMVPAMVPLAQADAFYKGQVSALKAAAKAAQIEAE
jgi:tripartite-type tricarboxylate transporter receptor subunit TctC